MKTINPLDAEKIRLERQAEFVESFDFEKFNKEVNDHFSNINNKCMRYGIPNDKKWQVPFIIPYLIDCGFEVVDYSDCEDAQGLSGYIEIRL